MFYHLKVKVKTIGGCYDTVKRNQLNKNYNFNAEEPKLISLWGNNPQKDLLNRFQISIPNHKKQNWFLPMPPPNITGQLHLGHSLFLTIQDIKTRFNTIIGNNTLWIPGTDHAGLATHEKIILSMKKKQIDLNNSSLYFEEAEKWKEFYQNRIKNQIFRMGAACNWEKERFTLDEQYINSSLKAFDICYENKMLYRKDDQYYLDMTKLAKDLLKDLKNGKIKITPESGKNTLISFLDNIEPWCISRQIPWGLPIPIAYNPLEERTAHLKDINSNESGWIKEDMTFDTWFLSSLWPAAILGWPNNTKDFENFYPCSWLETGDDIIFFWCARMLMMCKLITGKYPFNKIYLHGIIRDKNNKKMSKSLGNGIDPLTCIETHGTDCLRWTLCNHTEPGLDIKFNNEWLNEEKKFINKIWQAARFIDMHTHFIDNKKQIKEGIFISEEMDKITEIWYDLLSKDKFSQCSRQLQIHFRTYFCDYWIEKNKKELWNENNDIAIEGLMILSRYLILFNPFIPFITTSIDENIFSLN